MGAGLGCWSHSVHAQTLQSEEEVTPWTNLDTPNTAFLKMERFLSSCHCGPDHSHTAWVLPSRTGMDRL